MTSRFSNRATGAAAATAIVLLVLLIVLLWTGVGQDYLQTGQKSSPRRNNSEFRVADDDSFEEDSDYMQRGQSSANHRPAGGTREYVRPMKISPLGLNEEDMLYASDHGEVEPVQLRHHSGHFRHRTANIWDPHPVYEFTAFQRNFHLVLEHDSGFASPDLKVTHIWHNSSTRRLPSIKSNGCFYKGYVKGDPASSVAVSLCHGMTGNIRTSTGNYFIEPFEVTTDHAKPMKHVIYEMARTGKDGKDLSHCGLDDYESFKFHMRKATSDARMKQESEMLFDYETEDRHLIHHFDGDEQDDYDTGHKNYKRKRSKRNIPEQYFVEMLVVADSSMANYHGNNTENYILALMYIVSGIFKDASIGNPITIAVVKLDILYDHSYVRERFSDHNGVGAPEMLREFCHDQANKNNNNEDSEFHHDTALLLTRENICRDAPAKKCETLGLAELGTMCDKSSCSLVQDNGLSAAFTIAHELGHVFNMPHDDAEVKCRNHPSRDSVSHVMSTSLKQGTNPWSWSECSRHFITEFLESRHSFCLRDPPVDDIIKKIPQDVFPGETIVGNRQCELLYGDGSRICSFMPVCSALWCNKLDSDSCQTLHMPWGDGTPCAEGAWCQKGVCVEKNRNALKKVDGGWGEWEEFGECSRSCGGGVAKSIRHCNNPIPQNGGSYCTGHRVQYKSCNTRRCPNESRDFRQEQCSAFDHNNHNIHGIPTNVKWVPKYGLLNDDRCVLYCRPEKGSSYYPLRDKVIDGTPCSPDSFDICVNGQCKPAGCDHVLYSSAKPDICGKCNGKNDTCRLVRGTYNESAKEEGYRAVTIIPAGASNLDIRQYGFHEKRDGNILVLKDGSLQDGAPDGKLLNNDKILTTFRKIIKWWGVILEYSGCLAGEERINATRPLPRDLVVEVLTVGNFTPPNISYQFTVPLEYKYMWKHLGEWESCDKVCKGRKKRIMRCVTTHTNGVVADHYCRDRKRPPVIFEKCNTECTLKWKIAGRSECDCERRIRNVTKQCIQEIETGAKPKTHVVHNSSCSHLPGGLPDVEECICVPVDWKYSEWSECSETCGIGIRRRTAYCMDQSREHYVDDWMCDPLTKITEEECKVGDCPKWDTGNWSECSVTCGNGTRTREIWCQRNNRVIDMGYCDASIRPVREEACMFKRCTFWSHSDFSKCSVTCGKGKKRRTAVCKNLKDEVVDNNQCKETERPSDRSEDCMGPPCPTEHNIEDNSIPMKTDRWHNIGYHKKLYPRWEVTRFGQCSVTCGIGIRKSILRCMMGDREVDPSNCDQRRMENLIQQTKMCKMDPCPSVKWVETRWSACKTCGRGTQERQVFCMSTTNDRYLEDKDCAPAGPKPEVEKPCFKSCTKYKWKYGPWSSCSATCGYGVKVRNVTCMKVTIESNEVDPPRNTRTVVAVDESNCPSKSRRRDRKRCRRKLCPHTWVEGQWTECSKTCGKGIQTRTVNCHQVNAYGWLDPMPLKNERMCNFTIRPSTERSCTIADCNSEYHWFPEEWQECTDRCGRKGTQRRNYTCRNKNGIIQHRMKCYGLNKPLPKSRPCNRRPCRAISCKDIQLQTHDRQDGEYMMLVGGKNMSIYCKGMNTVSPEEYLTLPYENSYSQFIDERLINNGAQCHDDLRKARHHICDCSNPNRYGRTNFRKVRLLVETLQIRTDDFNFTETTGAPIPFGEAGGCCCLPKCHAMGNFTINLNGTSLQVSPSPMERWVMRTRETKLSCSLDGFRISCTCGSGIYGTCGSCGPSTPGRLKLHVVPP